MTAETPSRGLPSVSTPVSPPSESALQAAASSGIFMTHVISYDNLSSSSVSDTSTAPDIASSTSLFAAGGPDIRNAPQCLVVGRSGAMQRRFGVRPRLDADRLPSPAHVCSIHFRLISSVSCTVPRNKKKKP